MPLLPALVSGRVIWPLDDQHCACRDDVSEVLGRLHD